MVENGVGQNLCFQLFLLQLLLVDLTPDLVQKRCRGRCLGSQGILKKKRKRLWLRVSGLVCHLGSLSFTEETLPLRVQHPVLASPSPPTAVTDNVQNRESWIIYRSSHLRHQTRRSARTRAATVSTTAPPKFSANLTRSPPPRRHPHER